MFGGGFDFFGGPGGGPGGPGGPRRGGSDKPVDNKRFYQLLGIEPGASEQEIKKAWRKTAATLHPDRGGDTQKFQEAQRAYEVLSDPQKKEIYDNYGEEALSGNDASGASAGGGMEDILQAMFGGGQRRGPSGPPRGKDVGMRVEVSLAELYMGAEKKQEWERKNLCSDCGGAGGPPEAKRECQTCDGHGVVIKTVRMGPMIQQQQMHCPKCNGQGNTVNPALACKKCSGVGIVEETVTLTFTIAPGMKNGEKIRLAQEGDRVMKEMIPGDVYMILQLVPNPDFERKGDHLIYKKKISLLESLTGFQFSITHLDGRILRVSSPSSSKPVHSVVKPGDLKIISNEGMPTHRNPLIKGSLVIVFEVEFPSTIGSIGKEEFATLHKFLPIGQYTHPSFKDWLPEEEQKTISSSSASNSTGKKRRNKKKKASVPQDTADATMEDSEAPVSDEPIDVLLEEISAEAFARMKQESSHAGRGPHHAHEEDDEDGGEDGGGAQCRVN